MLAVTKNRIVLLKCHAADALVPPYFALSRISRTMIAGGDGGGFMKSSVVKRSIVIDGHKTSVSLEDAFWSDLKEIARARRATLSKLVADIDQARQQNNLSSAIRLFILAYVREDRTTEGQATQGPAE